MRRASYVPIGVDVPLAGWGVRAVGAIVDGVIVGILTYASRARGAPSRSRTGYLYLDLARELRVLVRSDRFLGPHARACGCCASRPSTRRRPLPDRPVKAAVRSLAAAVLTLVPLVGSLSISSGLSGIPATRPSTTRRPAPSCCAAERALAAEQVGHLCSLLDQLGGRRPDPLRGELAVLLARHDLPPAPVAPHREPELQPSGTPYSPRDTTASETHSPGGVGRRMLTTESMAAFAALAADDKPRAAMIAAPRCCTVVRNSPSSHARSGMTSTAGRPPISAFS